MLYEVITDASVEASDHSTNVTGNYDTNPAYDYPCVTCHDPHGTGVEDATHGSNHMVRRDFVTSSRITSYNVCYTKLLRNFFIAAFLV